MAGKPNPPKEYARECTGRPSKFTPDRCGAIIAAIARRAPYAMAAEANGINPETLYEWLRIGKRHINDGIESDYTIFSETLRKIDLEKALELSDSIASCPDRWQAHAWLLERRWHQHYGTNAQLNELNAKLDKLMEGEKHEREREERSQKDD